MRTTFINSLVEIAEKNDKIVLVVGDLGFNVVEPFQKKFPKRFFNAGVAEQNMASFSAGLASQGFKVFVYSIANFPTFRCAEQLRNDIDYHKLDVTIVTVGAGYAYGNLGYSHHAVQDYGLIRLFPNFNIFVPGDILEVEASLNYISNNNGPNYLRLNKNNDPKIFKNKLKFSKGRFNYFRKIKKSKKLILTTGSALISAVKFSEKKNYSNFSIASCPLWSPNSRKNISKQLSNFNEILVMEDHYLDGGFYSYILETIAKYKIKNLNTSNFSLSSKYNYFSASQKVLNLKNGLI